MIMIKHDHNNSHFLIGKSFHAQIILPEQGWVLQTRLSLDSPAQYLPPLLGGGLVQVRRRACIPRSHSRLHLSQGSHCDHLPSVEENVTTVSDIFFTLTYVEEIYTGEKKVGQAKKNAKT